MALLSSLLQRRFSVEEIEPTEQTTTTVEVAPTDTAGEVEISSTTVAVDGAGSEPQEPAAEVEADNTLDEVRAEVEEVQDQQSDLAAAQDTSERLDETVASMEALLDRGFASSTEVKLLNNRARSLLKRLDITCEQLSTEALDSEEGRMEALALSTESFKEKAGQLVSAIATGAKRVKDRVLAAVHAAISVDERYNQLGKQLVTAADSCKDSKQVAPVVKLGRGRYKYLADGSFQAMDPAKVAKTLLSFTKYLTGDYAKKVAALKNGGQIPALKLPNGLPGAPTAEMRSGTHSAAILFELHYEGQPKDLTVKTLSGADIKNVGQAMVEITDLLRSKWLIDMLHDEDGDTFNIRDQLASSLLEVAIYARHVVAALYAVAHESLNNFEDAE